MSKLEILRLFIVEFTIVYHIKGFESTKLSTNYNPMGLWVGIPILPQKATTWGVHLNEKMVPHLPGEGC